MYIIVAGAGLVGGALVEHLIENKHDVVVIEQNKETCGKLYAKTGAVAINGSVTSIDILREAGMEKADVAVAATEVDTDNLAFSILCKSFGVPQVIARMRNPEYEKSYKVAGVDSILRVTNLLVNNMMIKIENPNAQRIATIGRLKADIYKIVVPERAIIENKTLESVYKIKGFPQGCVFIAKVNDKDCVYSFKLKESVVLKGDEIYFISDNKNVTKAVEILMSQYKERRK